MKLVKLAIIFMAIYAMTAQAADVRPSFPSTEDATSKAGVPLTSAVEGDAAAGVNAQGALVAKDPSGNLIYIKTNADGSVVVDTELVGGTKKYARGKVTGSGSMATVATITLAVSTTYSQIEWVTSSFRQAVCEIVFDNDGTPTILADTYMGAGGYTNAGRLENVEFTSGATGDQTLIVQCLSNSQASDIRASIATIELD